MFICQYCKREGKTRASNIAHEAFCSLNPDTDVQRRLELQRQNSLNNGSGKRLKELRETVITTKCSECDKVLDIRQLQKHSGSKSCTKNKHKHEKLHNKMGCIYCGCIPRYDMSKHITICRKNPDNKKGFSWSAERREKHSNIMKRAVIENPDSYTKNNVCGRVKNIEYNGASLKGNWEVNTARWLDSLGILWENEVNPQSYFWHGRWHLYFPDFYLPKYDYYIEVKGYKTERDYTKWSQFKGVLIIIDKNVIHKLSDYDIMTLKESNMFR